jgi:hypothetical protein
MQHEQPQPRSSGIWHATIRSSLLRRHTFSKLPSSRPDRCIGSASNDLPTAGGGSSAGSRETWCTLHTLLSSRSGSSEELAVLLASLLLGHGLDAYVAVGRRK